MLEIKKQEIATVVKEERDIGVYTCDRCGVKCITQVRDLPYFETPLHWASLKYEEEYYHLCPKCVAVSLHLPAEVFNARESD